MKLPTRGTDHHRPPSAHVDQPKPHSSDTVDSHTGKPRRHFGRQVTHLLTHKLPQWGKQFLNTVRSLLSRKVVVVEPADSQIKTPQMPLSKRIDATREAIKIKHAALAEHQKAWEVEAAKSNTSIHQVQQSDQGLEAFIAHQNVKLVADTKKRDALSALLTTVEPAPTPRERPHIATPPPSMDQVLEQESNALFSVDHGELDYPAVRRQWVEAKRQVQRAEALLDEAAQACNKGGASLKPLVDCLQVQYDAEVAVCQSLETLVNQLKPTVTPKDIADDLVEPTGDLSDFSTNDRLNKAAALMSVSGLVGDGTLDYSHLKRQLVAYEKEVQRTEYALNEATSLYGEHQQMVEAKRQVMMDLSKRVLDVTNDINVLQNELVGLEREASQSSS